MGSDNSYEPRVTNIRGSPWVNFREIPQKRPDNYQEVKLLDTNVKQVKSMTQKDAGMGKKMFARKRLLFSQMTEIEKLESKFDFTKMIALSHPYLGKIFEVYSEGEANHEVFHVISEWNEGDTLQSLIQARHKDSMLFTEEEIFHYFAIVALAVEECHSVGLVHRNISSAHIYVSKDKKEVKLHNIQPACMKEIRERKFNDKYLGEHYYIAPEVHESIQIFDKPADIWGLGMLLFEMVKMDKEQCCVHRAQYGTPLTRKMVEKKEHHFIPEHYSKEVHYLLDQCLQCDPEERPTIQKLLRFPGIITQVNKLEQSLDFFNKLRESLNFKINYGWVSKKEYIRYMQIKKNSKAIEKVQIATAEWNSERTAAEDKGRRQVQKAARQILNDEENNLGQEKAKEDDYYVVAAAETYNFKNAKKKAKNLLETITIEHYDSIKDDEDILYFYVDDYFKRLGVHSRFTQFKVGKEGDICEDIDYDSFFKMQEANELLAASKGVTSVAIDGVESITNTREFTQQTTYLLNLFTGGLFVRFGGHRFLLDKSKRKKEKKNKEKLLNKNSQLKKQQLSNNRVTQRSSLFSKKQADQLDVEDQLCQPLFEQDSTDSDDDAQEFVRRMNDKKQKLKKVEEENDYQDFNDPEEEQITFGRCMEQCVETVEQFKRSYSQVEEPFDYYSLVYQIQPEEPEETTQLIKTDFNEKSEANLLEILESDPKNFNCLKELTKKYLENMQYKDCLEYCQVIIDQKIGEREVEIWFLKARAESASKLIEECIESLKTCLDLDIDHYGASIFLGNVLLEQEQGRKAAKYYQNGIRIKPDSISAHFGLMVSVRQIQEKSSKAVSHLKLLLKNDPDSFQICTQLAIIRYLQYENVKSMKLIYKALSLNPNYVPALMLTGELLRFSGETVKAKMFYRLVLDQDSKQASAILGLAKSCFLNNDFDEAYVHYQEYWKLHADIHVTEGDLLEMDQYFRLRLGIKFRELGNLETNKRYREKAMNLHLDGLKLDPEFMPGLVNLSRLKLDFMIFWHREEETFFEQRQVFTVLWKVCEFLVQAKKDGLYLARTEIAPSNLIIIDNGVPIIATQHENTNVLYFRNDINFADPETQLRKRAKDEERAAKLKKEQEEAEELKRIEQASLTPREREELQKKEDAEKIKQQVLKPDVVKKRKIRKSNDDECYKALIWSLGCCILSMITKCDPSKEMPLKISALYEKDLQTVVKEMLHIDPEKRPTAESILSRKFLATHIQKEMIKEQMMMNTKVLEQQMGKHMNKYLEEFEEVKKLGEGAFGAVMLVKRQKDGLLFAAKKQLGTSNFETAKKELLMLQKFKHRFIVNCEESFHDRRTGQLIMILEFCNHGDLTEQIIQWRKQMKKAKMEEGEGIREEFIKQTLVQILEALKYAHALQVFHQDMKPDNVFMMTDGSVKLGDFGIAKCLASTDQNKDAKGTGGTLYYMPPEIWRGERANYTGDIWAVGCILREMITGEIAFKYKTEEQIRKAVLKDCLPRLPKCYSRELRAMVWQCLNKKAESRPSAKDMLKHKLLSKMADDQLSETCKLISPVVLLEKNQQEEIKESNDDDFENFDVVRTQEQMNTVEVKNPCAINVDSGSDNFEDYDDIAMTKIVVHDENKGPNTINVDSVSGEDDDEEDFEDFDDVAQTKFVTTIEEKKVDSDEDKEDSDDDFQEIGNVGKTVFVNHHEVKEEVESDYEPDKPKIEIEDDSSCDLDVEDEREENYRLSQEFVVCSKKAGDCFPYYPSKDMLLKMSELQLSKHRITHVLHDGDKMHYLSFKFSKGEVGPAEMISPALGSYKYDPKREDPIPAFPEVAKVVFDTWKNTQKEVMLYALSMLSDKGERILYIRPKDKVSRHHKTQELDIWPGERICSARVTINEQKFWPVEVQFMIYDLV